MVNQVTELLKEIMHKNQVQETKAAMCDKHGAFTQTIRVSGKKSQCPVCRQQWQQQESAHEAAIKQQELMAKFGKAGIPKRHQACTVSSYQATNDGQIHFKNGVVEYVKEMKSGSLKRNMVLLGNCGTGKTHMACAIGMEAVRDGKTVLFATVSEVIRRIQATHKSATETEYQLMNSYAEIDLLILDEVGVQYNTESSHRIMTEIVNERYNAEKPTIFISNLGKAEFSQLMGQRVMSRMREDGCKPFVCDWQDYRVAKGSER